MNKPELEQLLSKQKDFFRTGKTLPVSYRKAALKKLRKAINDYEGKITDAIKADLGKSASEAYMCEIGLVKSEITFMLGHVGKFAREKRVCTPLAQYVSRSFKKPSPYGNVLIMSPWNYPFLLTFGPLVDAIAAGNTVIIKPSAYSPATSAVIEELIKSTFDDEYIAVVMGGRAENTALLEMDFNYIFFTGSQAVGKEVMRHAADRLIPVTLELGGKSPCIVDASADIKLAAKRIVFGKFLNCGQTCVAPDYILCDITIKNRLVEEIKKQITLQFGENPLENEDYGKIINRKHFDRLCGIIEDSKVLFGGQVLPEKEKIAPTIIDEQGSYKAMSEEIFGPILPIIEFDNVGYAIDYIRNRPEPLALYIFSGDKGNIKEVTSSVQYGGGCINDVVIHLATSSMGFGGVGASGMGSYHGKDGFDTFTHYKSIVDKKTFIDLPMRYAPYKGWKDKLIRMFVK